MATMMFSGSPTELSPTSMTGRSQPTSHPHVPTLPPLNTAASRPVNVNPRRVSTYANKRLSSFSMTSNAASRSRPQSSVFPLFHSSLPYALVRDFAYPSFHPLHYGPGPEPPSGLSTPASEAQRRLSDPPPSWDGNTRGGWSTGPWAAAEGLFNYGGPQLPSTAFERFERGDGPPYSEDEDLHSPVVTSTRHKKHKSSSHNEFDRGRRRSRDQSQRRTSYAGTNGDGNNVFYVSHDNDSSANGPGGEFVTYPAGQEPHTNARQDSAYSSTHPNQYQYTNPQARYPSSPPSPTHIQRSSNYPRHNPYFLPGGQKPINSPPQNSPGASSSSGVEEESRYSRDYSFTIASPDEEMHGKAIALFDFHRENENELPLHEGQVILVSYRHGQGWLVAQDPLSGESGLVPEEYVRLLREIEGGWMGLMGADGLDHSDATDIRHPPDEAPPLEVSTEHEDLLSPYDVATPTQAMHQRASSKGSNVGVSAVGTERTGSDASQSSNASGTHKTGVYTPVVSTFSTSSKDFEPHGRAMSTPALKIPGNLQGQVRKPLGEQGRGSEPVEEEEQGSS